jgi:RNA polymerase sigma-70 factor (ECF subfamily)
VDGVISEPVPAAIPVVGAAALSFEDFYRGGRDRVARALALTLGDAHLAADAVDEAMARAYQRWDRVGRFDNPGGWVYRVALNWSLSALQRRRRPVRAVHDRDPQDVEQPGEPAVRAALLELDVRQRAVVVCRFYLGLSERETADALGIRPGTAKSRLHRGLKALEDRLAHLAPEEP